MSVSHTTLNDNSNTGNMNTIQLFKTTETYIPKVLLATVSVPPSSSPPPVQDESNPNPNPNVPIVNVIRPKLMLRNPNKPLNKTEKSPNSSSKGKGHTLMKKPSQPDNLDQSGQSTDDVESRYAAAKARIFGCSSSNGDGNGDNGNSNITAASTLPKPPVSASNSTSNEKNKFESNNKPSTPMPPTSTPTPVEQNKEDNTVLSDYKKEKRVVNVSQDWGLKSNANNNSTLRNKTKEKSDPDFARNQKVNNHGNVAAPTTNTNTNANTNGNGQYNNYSQQQYPHKTRVHIMVVGINNRDTVINNIHLILRTMVMVMVICMGMAMEINNINNINNINHINNTNRLIQIHLNIINNTLGDPIFIIQTIILILTILIRMKIFLHLVVIIMVEVVVVDNKGMLLVR